MNKIYQLVSKGKTVKLTLEQLLQEHEVVGYKDNEYLRKELQNSPLIKGYVGAMFNGYDEETKQVVLRYETQEVYNMFSN